MNCEFCTVKGKPRFGSPERMMEQFASVYEKWGGKDFFIVDDLFGQNRGDALRLCQLLRDYQAQLGVRFNIMVQIRLDRARDGELLLAMRQARIDTLAIGFESPIAEELKAMNKHLDPQEMIGLTQLYRQAGFRIHGMFIFGYPAPDGRPFRMSEEDRMRHFQHFIRASRLDTVQVLLPVPLPGTEMTARLAKAHRIYSTDTVGLEYYDGSFPLFEPDAPMTPEGMQAAVQKIMRDFYGPRHFLALAVHVLALPGVALWFHNIGGAWQRWCHRWGCSVSRSGGWLLWRKWTAAFRKDGFLDKLAEAKRNSASKRGDESYSG